MFPSLQLVTLTFIIRCWLHCCKLSLSISYQAFLNIALAIHLHVKHTDIMLLTKVSRRRLQLSTLSILEKLGRIGHTKLWFNSTTVQISKILKVLGFRPSKYILNRLDPWSSKNMTPALHDLRRSPRWR
jgi:hypothetical protein